MAMQISLASFIHAKVGAFNQLHHISLHTCHVFRFWICQFCRLQSFGGSHRRTKSRHLAMKRRQLVRLDTERDLQVTPVASSLWYLCSRSAEFALIQYHVYSSHNILYIRTHMDTFLQLNPSEFWCQRWRSLLQDVQHGSQAGLASSAGEQRKTQLCARSTCRRLKKQSH